MKQEQVTSIFNLAGLPVVSLLQIRNGYWPNHENYDEVRNANPWWEVGTSEGVIRIGWRKRVIEIDWPASKRRGIVTQDDVTKDDHMVHAYSLGDAVSYLSKIRQLPIQEIINVGDRSYLIHGKKDAQTMLDHLLKERLTSTQKAMIELILSQLTEETDQVTMRLVRNEDYYTLKLKTAKVYLEIQP